MSAPPSTSMGSTLVLECHFRTQSSLKSSLGFPPSLKLLWVWQRGLTQRIVDCGVPPSKDDGKCWVLDWLNPPTPNCLVQNSVTERRSAFMRIANCYSLCYIALQWLHGVLEHLKFWLGVQHKLQGVSQWVNIFRHPFSRTYVDAAGCPFMCWTGIVPDSIFWKKMWIFIAQPGLQTQPGLQQVEY